MPVILESDVLRNAREGLGLSVRQVAEKANVSLRQYQRFETGERSLSSSSFVIARRVLEALGLDVASFGKSGGDGSVEPVIEYQERIETEYASACEMFKDKICVFIGRLERCSKQEAQERVFAAGGVPQNNIAAFVSFVIAGKVSESSKVYKEALHYEKRGLLTILSEQEFFDALDGREIPAENKRGLQKEVPSLDIQALLNQKRAEYIASRRIIGTDENLLDARSAGAVQNFIQRYMSADITGQVRSHYEKIVSDLEQSAELLLDTSGFINPQKDGNGFSMGYNKILNADQWKAVIYAEYFLESIDDCKCPAKLRKRRNSTADEHRSDQSRWMKSAAGEIRRKLDEEHDDSFWDDRNPIFLHLKMKKPS